MALQEPEIDEAEWYPVKDKFSVRKQISLSHQEFRVIQSSSAKDMIIVSFTGTSSFTAEEGTVSKEVSLEEFAALQQQIVELYPSLKDANITLDLPQPPRGLMSYIMSTNIPDKFFIDAVDYLNQLSNHCGVDNVLRVFLQLADDYEEHWDNLNRIFYAEEWKTALQDYEEVVSKRTQLEFKSMEELHNYYEEEDEAFFFLDRKERRHYKFQIQPYEDLCNIVSAERDEAVVRLSDVNLPITELARAMQEQAECQEHYLEARTQLQQIKLLHHQALAERMELRLRRVEEDKCCLSVIWDRKGDGRLIQLYDALNGVIVTMLKLHCQQLADQKEQALLSMAMVKEGPNMAQEVAQKEDEVFRIQLQYFNLQQRLLEEEETKLKYKFDFVGQEQKDKLKRKLNQIPAKIAQMRIKQRECRAMLEERSRRVINVEESISAQLAFQMKEKFIKQDEQKKQDEFRASRQKTIHRLKKYQERNVTPQKVLPPRYQPPSQRSGVKKKVSKREASHEPILPSMRTLEIASLVVSKQQQQQLLLQPPPVPPPPIIDPLTEQLIAEQNAMSAVPSFVPPPPPPAPPPPPPPPAAPPPPGPVIQQQQEQLTKDEKPQSTKTSTTSTIPSQLAITTDIIINAKERLRKSSSTAKKGLSADNADFLRERINEKFTGTFSESHDSDSSDDDWN